MSLGVCLISIDPVLSSIFCKDSTIDSIAFSNDLRMYFIASTGHYWWIKEDRFPPKDSDAKKLPAPLTKTTAATYIDGDSGCKANPQARDKAGLKAHEKEVWVTEVIDEKVILMAFDVKLGVWSTKAPVKYDEDRCISKARIDFSGGKPIDAMFTTKNLEVYLVQGDKYAMVDCNFICTDPTGKFGEDKPDNPTTDLQSKEPIFGMFTMDDQKLVMFEKKIYYVLSIMKAENGKISTSKAGTGKDILKDFLRLSKTEDCTGDVTPPPLDAPASNDMGAPTAAAEGSAAPAEGETTTSRDEGGGGSMLWIIIIIIIIILVIIGIVLCLFFAMKKKEEEPKPADAEAAVGATPSKAGATGGSKVGSKIDGGAAGGSKAGSKVEGGGLTPAKSSAMSTMGSTMSTRSGIAQSSIPKSSTGGGGGGVKSTVSKTASKK